ncbi:LAFA_0G10044g1_1 [Lachancea sp. 'fantastica']|nr:LAFA_0G10044g1_1 [Lachancea sp. 'fantastica']
MPVSIHHGQCRPFVAMMYAKPLVRYTGSLTRSPKLWHGFARPRFNSSASLDSFASPSRVINAQNNLNINITQRAAKRLAEIAKESNEALRICVESGGCHGFQYNLKLIKKDEIKLKESSSLQEQPAKASEADEFDQDFEENDDDADFESNQDTVFELSSNGGQVVLDEKSLKILNNTTLTYTTELIGSTFKIMGGNMKNSCGCGSSFDVEL